MRAKGKRKDHKQRAPGGATGEGKQEEAAAVRMSINYWEEVTALVVPV